MDKLKEMLTILDKRRSKALSNINKIDNELSDVFMDSVDLFFNKFLDARNEIINSFNGDQLETGRIHSMILCAIGRLSMFVILDIFGDESENAFNIFLNSLEEAFPRWIKINKQKITDNE